MKSVPLPPAFLTDVEDLDIVLLWNGRCRLKERLLYRTRVLGKALLIAVPVGAVVDWASFPSPARAVWRPDGKWGPAAGVHDWLYQTGGKVGQHFRLYLNRKQADQVFLEAMKVLGVAWPLRWAFYLAVRIGGAPHWKGGSDGAAPAAAQRAA